jgi:hypothetical protein
VLNSLIEFVGYSLVVAFFWFVWPPACLLAAGVLLIVWANVRAASPAQGRRRWWRRTKPKTAELSRVA